MNQDQTTQTTSTEPTNGDKLRAMAVEVRQNPTARETIADALELIAECMNPCTDCAAQQQAAPEVDPAGAVA